MFREKVGKIKGEEWRSGEVKIKWLITIDRQFGKKIYLKKKNKI